MNNYLNEIPLFVDRIKSLADTIITNIVLIGQVPSPTFEEAERANALLERLSESGVEQCTTDSIGNPVGIIKGKNPDLPPIFVVAHLDTVVDKEVDHNFTVKKNSIIGAGILDNSIGIGVLASLPDIFRACEMTFDSDIVLAGVVRSIGRGNLQGINTLLANWETPIRGAVCVEGRELGRLSYTSEGLKRCEITCSVGSNSGSRHRLAPNAILVLNEIINQILELRLPQKPHTRVIIGRISGGAKHGVIAHNAKLGFEIQSDSAEMVKSAYADIKDIVSGAEHEYQVNIRLKSISEQAPSRLTFSHPLVKATVKVMKNLRIEPVNMPSESELSAFLSRQIPAVTLGITHGEESFVPEQSRAKIEPIFKGIAQVVGVINALDSGECDG
ncbi:MAG: peptidase dimerization domain-containing protein [Thermodesulfobacteriota bacterium]|nr:peptidase dimerization domain-containing protein [Thermodesulfobacteriota bacterium]